MLTQPPSTSASTSSSPLSTDPDEGGGSGGQRDSKGTTGVGDRSLSDPSATSTGTAGADGLPGGMPVKNAPASGSSQAATGTGDGEPTFDPGDPTDAPTSTPTDVPTETPTGTPTTVPTDPPTTDPTVPPTSDGKVRIQQVLRYYNDVLAKLLDPVRAHLQPYDPDVDAKQLRTNGNQLYALGSTFRWVGGRTPSTLGITVASGWDQVDWDCGASGTGWSCHEGTTPGSEVARHDGLLQVAVEHPSGQVVVLTADPAYDAAGRTARGLDPSEDDLALAAADSRLVLPGVAPVAPPRIDPAAFAAAGIEALVGAGERFQQTASDRAPSVRGDWTGTRGQQGALSWALDPVYSGGAFSCLTSFRSCTEVVVDDQGTTVHLALLKARAGGGWLVQYDGGSYDVRVYSSSWTLPKKRAYAFVTQQAWQPTR
jgi:hypothetical protein